MPDRFTYTGTPPIVASGNLQPVTYPAGVGKVLADIQGTSDNPVILQPWNLSQGAPGGLFDIGTLYQALQKLGLKGDVFLASGNPNIDVGGTLDYLWGKPGSKPPAGWTDDPLWKQIVTQGGLILLAVVLVGLGVWSLIK